MGVLTGITVAVCAFGHRRRFVAAAGMAAAFLTGTAPVLAQRAPLPPMRHVIVVGEGSVRQAPDTARIGAGVTTRARTAKDALDANSKLMAAVIAAIGNAGIEQKDIQTTWLSLQPVYLSEGHNESKLVGFTASNRVNVTIRRLDNVGVVLDRLTAAGATDISGVQFLHSDPASALDQARAAAIADARRKAAIYARASGLALGAVNFISEEGAANPPGPILAMRAAAVSGTVPIAPGEDTMTVRVTVGFDMAP